MNSRKLQRLAGNDAAAFRRAIKGARRREFTARHLWVAENPLQPQEYLGREHGSVEAKELFRYSRVIQRGENRNGMICPGHGHDAALLTGRLVSTLDQAAWRRY
jgi:hypothetical protein